jgi:NAD(P)-dependent dehydrogenase (short-subunit alcohol dehydrogenase family)
VLVDVEPAVRGVADAVGGTVFVGDVRDRSFAQRTVHETAARFGGLHGLVNVAGVQRSGDVVSMDLETWDAVLAVNLTAPFLWAQCVIPVMLEGGGGSIVNVASIAGTHAIRNSAAYVASKHGLLGLTRSVSTDFGTRGIRCNAVSPGSVETELLSSYMDANPEAGRRLVDANFTGRLGQPAEIAAWCAYLLGDMAGFVNGSNLVVDGGRTAAT